MGLIEQMRLLDRALRDRSARSSVAKKKGPDAAVLAAVDPGRLDAVAVRQSEMIRDRWWRVRFPGTLGAAALATGGTTADVARAALASEHYDRREGEDETGRVLLGSIVDRAKQLPAWVLEVAAYEYVIGIGLPRRARGQSVDLELEQALLPEGTHFLEPSRAARAGEVALARPAAVLPLALRAGELRAPLANGKKPARRLLDAAAIAPLVFAVQGESALEVELSTLAADVVSLVAEPLDERALLEGFADEDRAEVKAALATFAKLGVVARGKRRGK